MPKTQGLKQWVRELKTEMTALFKELKNPQVKDICVKMSLLGFLYILVMVVFYLINTLTLRNLDQEQDNVISTSISTPTIQDNNNEQSERLVTYSPQQPEKQQEAQTETTLYDTFTEKEINMLEVTVQHEVGAFSDEYKTLIAELIYNRLISEDFPDDIEQVLFQEYQFSGIDYWYTPHFDVDDETKEVVKEVFSQDNTSHEATYYYNPELSDYQSVVLVEYSGDVEYCFEYTEEDWGIEYTTRFFK